MRTLTRATLTRATLPAALAALALAATLVGTSSASADGMTTHYRHAGWHIYLPPERHVIEKVRPPGSGVFVINGRTFASPACPHWTAGDRITLIAGDWNGYCETATFRNLSRRGTCTMSCSGWW